MNQPTQTVFDQVLLRSAPPEAAGTCLLSWQMNASAGYRVQVYINGRLHDTAVDAQQRQMWLHLDRSIENRVALLAVDPADRWTDHSDQLSIDPPANSLAEFALHRDLALPVDAEVELSVDGQATHRGPLWSALDTRGGFGGVFGHGEFGHDDLTGPGLGLGEFGAGPFGSDGAAWRWSTGRLTAGDHTIGVSVLDDAGRTVGEFDEPRSITVDALPKPASAITFENSPTGLTLKWSAPLPD